MVAATAGGSENSSVFDWEKELRADARLLKMQCAVDRILKVNFSPSADQPPVQPSLTSSTAEEKAEFIDAAMYTSESMSEAEMREVDPMDELSDFEPQKNQQKRQQRVAEVEREETKQEEEPSRVDQAMEYTDDVVMTDETEQQQPQEQEAEAENQGMDEEDQTACTLCGSAANGNQILLCDGCDAEFHMYCLRPALTKVPEGDWFCPDCSRQRAKAATTIVSSAETSSENRTKEPSAANIKQERTTNTSSNGAMNEEAPAPLIPPPAANTESNRVTAPQPPSVNQQLPVLDSNTTENPSSTSISIAQSFEQDAEKSNQLLIHACNCDELRCSNAQFQEFCPHMKRFLRSACWISHNPQWRAFRIAKVTAELFAYHAMHCNASPSCNVPLCDQLRAEELV